MLFSTFSLFHCLIFPPSFQGLWANNGDALSRQYAGTNALKGDFTRTGERNLSGLMKDGMNSASRYYLNQFRDAYRQATIDLMTGQIVRYKNILSTEPSLNTRSCNKRPLCSLRMCKTLKNPV